MKYNVELKVTSDNSHTLLVKELNETYHSTKGALREALHVFIQKGLKDYLFTSQLSNLNVFEVGFGTGLNSHLTQLFAQENNVRINYTTIEAFPLSIEIVDQLNYCELLNSNKNQFLNLHRFDWDKEYAITPYFCFTKLQQKLQYLKITDKFDIIFFDAFAPDVQPEMWTKEVFEMIFEMLKNEGILVTYCAKGIVKRTLKQVGFELETLPGPPGKREMIMATKRKFK